MENRTTNRSVKSGSSSDKVRDLIYKKMSAGDKLRATGRLYFLALTMKKERLKQLHPEWSTQQIENEAKEWMLYART